MINSNTYFIPPQSGPRADGAFTIQKLAASGSTETYTSRALALNKGHILVVGDAAIAVSFRGEAGLTDVVDPDEDLVLQPGTIFPFKPATRNTVYVYAESAKGSGTYSLDIFQASAAA